MLLRRMRYIHLYAVNDNVDLKLGSAAENKGDGASEKSPESKVSKEGMTKSAGSSKEQESEAHGSEENMRQTRSSKKRRGGEFFCS